MMLKFLASVFFICSLASKSSCSQQPMQRPMMTGGVCSIKYKHLTREEQNIIDDLIQNDLGKFNGKINSRFLYRNELPKEDIIVTKQVVSGIIYTAKVHLVPTLCIKADQILSKVQYEDCEVAKELGENIDREFVVYVPPYQNAVKEYSEREPRKLPYEAECPH